MTRLITEPRVSSVEARAPGRAEDDLGRVEGVRRRDERLADVRADDLAVGAAELLDELALLARAGRRLPPARPSCGRTWTAMRSPFDRAAMRAARRTRRSPSAEPVRATTTRSRVSQGRSIPWRSR